MTEDIYDQALDMLAKGCSQEQILLKFPQANNQLKKILATSSMLYSLPKNILPTPLMQKKYALSPVKHFWLSWAHLIKLASLSASLMLLLSAFAATGYAAWQSTPGTPLFKVKKSAEWVELSFTTSQSAKASLQLAIAEQRLNDAQTVFNNPASNVSAKSAALTELANQTSNAIASAKGVAQQNPSSSQNHPLLSSLENLTNQQKNLISKIKADSPAQPETQTALLAFNQTLPSSPN